MKRKSQVTYKSILIKNRSYSEIHSLWAIFCSANHYETNFVIPYHFPEFMHLVFKTRWMRYQCQIKVAFPEKIACSALFAKEDTLEGLFANRCS